RRSAGGGGRVTNALSPSAPAYHIHRLTTVPAKPTPTARHLPGPSAVTFPSRPTPSHRSRNAESPCADGTDREATPPQPGTRQPGPPQPGRRQPGPRLAGGRIEVGGNRGRPPRRRS